MTSNSPSSDDSHDTDPTEQESALAPDEREILYRVDERVEHIDSRLDKAVSTVDENAEEIDEVQQQVQRNTTIINAATVGLSSLLVWTADKLSRFNFL